MTYLNRFLFHLVNDVWTSRALVPYMVFLGHINDYGVVWLVLLGALAALGGKTGRWAALAGLTALVVGLAASEVLKSLTMQPRPFVSLPDVRLRVSPPSSYSFPSVNARYAFAASSGASLTARCLVGRLPVWSWGYLALAVATPTTIITFLLVALLQNAQRRGEQAIHKKLDAIADGMADLMSHFADEDNDLREEIEDLKAAVGLEEEV